VFDARAHPAGVLVPHLALPWKTPRGEAREGSEGSQTGKGRNRGGKGKGRGSERGGHGRGEAGEHAGHTSGGVAQMRALRATPRLSSGRGSPRVSQGPCASGASHPSGGLRQAHLGQGWGRARRAKMDAVGREAGVGKGSSRAGSWTPQAGSLSRSWGGCGCQRGRGGAGTCTCTASPWGRTGTEKGHRGGQQGGTEARIRERRESRGSLS